MTQKKKLIEVALPLDAINKASAGKVDQPRATEQIARLEGAVQP